LAFQSEAKVELELEEGFLKVKFNSENMNDITIKLSQVSSESIGAEARKLLAASLAKCMCSTLLFLLKWARVKFEKFRAVANVSVTKDEKGKLCVGEIKLKIHIKIPKDNETLERFKKVEKIFKRGCLMSRSIERGIKVSYSIIT